MPGRFPEVDSFGREVDPTQGQYRADDREGSFDHRYGSADRFEDDWSRRRHRSYSPSRSRSRSRSHRRHHERKAWEVPFNPLALAHEGDHSRSSTRHRHRHHHHHHHHHHESDSDERRDFARKNNTPADKKERWGHELYIENVILNPEPEPERIVSNYEPPREKWISKAGGVAIFTSKPTSASSYQGKREA